MRKKGKSTTRIEIRRVANQATKPRQDTGIQLGIHEPNRNYEHRATKAQPQISTEASPSQATEKPLLRKSGARPRVETRKGWAGHLPRNRKPADRTGPRGRSPAYGPGRDVSSTPDRPKTEQHQPRDRPMRLSPLHSRAKCQWRRHPRCPRVLLPAQHLLQRAHRVG